MLPRGHELELLQNICASFYGDRTDRHVFLSDVIDVFMGWLHCSRVSLWRFDGEPGALSMLCFCAKRAGGELQRDATRFEEPAYRAYLASQVQNGMYASDDTMNDPDLVPMRETYLVPHGIVSMLDAAFLVNGRTYGAVCCEQTDAPRRWRADEIAGLRTMVAKLAVLVAGAGDRDLWDSPSVRLSPMR